MANTPETWSHRGVIEVTLGANLLQSYWESGEHGRVVAQTFPDREGAEMKSLHVPMRDCPDLSDSTTIVP